MKKIIFLLIVSVLIFSCKTESKQKIEENSQTTVISKTPVLALAEFDDKAGEFINKEVEVKGIVDHVCTHGGKKILLVNDNANVHITSDERFDENLKGSEISVIGVVLEERIDEAACLKMEEDNIKSHAEGASSKAQFEAKTNHIQQYRDLMKTKNIDYVSLYSLKYISHSEVE